MAFIAADLTLEAKGSLPLQRMAHDSHGSVETHPVIEGDDKENDAEKNAGLYFGFLGLKINALVFFLDATSFAVAIPVRLIAS